MDDQTTNIPLPDLLDPARRVVSSRSDWFDHNLKDLVPALEELVAELRAYSRQLWNDADDMRTYLLRHQPEASLAHIDTTADSSSSSGRPARHADWDAWINAYAAMTTVLAGPNGDAGFGREEADRIAQHRVPAR